MIEYVSYPAPLAEWNPPSQPFYLEVCGETSPVLDTASAEVMPAGKDAAVSSASAPVYEYWWTLAHPNSREHADSQPDVLSRPDDSGQPVWERLRASSAARVYLYFPVSQGWRIREIMATVKYLTPVQQQESWWDKAGKDLRLLTPLVGDAGNIVDLIPGGATVSKWLTTISKLQLSSVPQTKDFPWTVEKVTRGGNGKEVMQGVVWNLPRSLLEAQGGRVTGSLAVSVLPAGTQRGEAVATTAAASAGMLRAYAQIFAEDGGITRLPDHVPAQDDNGGFAELRISPVEPTRKQPDPGPGGSGNGGHDHQEPSSGS